MTSRSHRHVVSSMLKLDQLTPYIGSKPMRSEAFLIASTFTAERMLSRYSFIGLPSTIFPSASAVS